MCLIRFFFRFWIKIWEDKDSEIELTYLNILQPLVVSAPQVVQKASFKSCCGIFDFFTSSDRWFQVGILNVYVHLWQNFAHALLFARISISNFQNKLLPAYSISPAGLISSKICLQDIIYFLKWYWLNILYNNKCIYWL